ncbi:hypothetical protein FNV43_RR24515 [Rhamnella rubrinervis]|uniref:Uncharacterized protein n=1 Tax=Rhamnella rubrinervis TaxID=2594499 RepID=A0A8K0DSK1_9ROSA|nr:hypothetical protein FNV43_RR24515 [Rhamnella rubrinervis]
MEIEAVGVVSSSSICAGMKGDDVVMVDASTPISHESVNYELKDLLSNISEDGVEQLRHFCEILHNITFRSPKKRKGPLNMKEGVITVHLASLEVSEGHLPVTEGNSFDPAGQLSEGSAPKSQRITGNSSRWTNQHKLRQAVRMNCGQGMNQSSTLLKWDLQEKFRKQVDTLSFPPIPFRPQWDERNGMLFAWLPTVLLVAVMGPSLLKSFSSGPEGILGLPGRQRVYQLISSYSKDTFHLVWSLLVGAIVPTLCIFVLSITFLRIKSSGRNTWDFILVENILPFCIVELPPVICYYGIRDSKPIDDSFENKVELVLTPLHLNSVGRVMNNLACTRCRRLEHNLPLGGSEQPAGRMSSSPFWPESGVGEMRTNLALHPWLVDTPSTYKLHNGRVGNVGSWILKNGRCRRRVLDRLVFHMSILAVGIGKVCVWLLTTIDHVHAYSGILIRFQLQGNSITSPQLVLIAHNLFYAIRGWKFHSEVEATSSDGELDAAHMLHFLSTKPILLHGWVLRGWFLSPWEQVVQLVELEELAEQAGYYIVVAVIESALLAWPRKSPISLAIIMTSLSVASRLLMGCKFRGSIFLNDWHCKIQAFNYNIWASSIKLHSFFKELTGNVSKVACTLILLMSTFKTEHDFSGGISIDALVKFPISFFLYLGQTGGRYPKGFLYLDGLP